jgi:hypothetical protein
MTWPRRNDGTMSGVGTPPGWYPDPYDPRILRWWDGQAWTVATMLGAPPRSEPFSPGPLPAAPDSQGPLPGGSVPPAPPPQGPLPGGPFPPAPPPQGALPGGPFPPAPPPQGALPGGPVPPAPLPGGALAQGPLGGGAFAPAPYAGGPFAGAPGLEGGAGGVGPAMVAALASEAELSRWAVWCTLAYPVLGTLGALELWADASGFKRLFHWFRTVVDNTGTPGYVAPPPPSLYQSGPAQALSVFVDLASLGALALFVLFLVWQYRAAVLARRLGYPARLSPGWGVGCWFVPVVDLWMPYQAIRDCLPPGNRVRGTVRRAWLLALVIQVISWAALATLVWVRPVGLVLLVVLVGAEGLLAWLARQVVIGISTDHRRAVIDAGAAGGAGGMGG